MKRKNSLWVAAMLIGAIGAGCGDDTTNLLGTGGTGGSGGVGPDGAVGPATFRVAQLVPDLPALDICVAPVGTTTFTGPLLAGFGVQGGLKYPQVTAYNSITTGTFVVRVVAAGSTDCNTPLLHIADVGNLPALQGGTTHTIALEGLVATGSPQPFQVHIYQDETTPIKSKVDMRFIHAAVGLPAVDVGLGSGSAFAPLFTNVTFSNVAKNAGVDTLGYTQTAPISNGTMSLRVAGTTVNSIVATGLNFDGGQIVTVFAIGVLGGTPAPLQLLFCLDGTRGSGPLTMCSAQP